MKTTSQTRRNGSSVNPKQLGLKRRGPGGAIGPCRKTLLGRLFLAMSPAPSALVISAPGAYTIEPRSEKPTRNGREPVRDMLVTAWRNTLDFGTDCGPSTGWASVGCASPRAGPAWAWFGLLR